jgi:hypothetical protein
MLLATTAAAMPLSGIFIFYRMLFPLAVTVTIVF